MKKGAKKDRPQVCKVGSPIAWKEMYVPIYVGNLQIVRCIHIQPVFLSKLQYTVCIPAQHYKR